MTETVELPPQPSRHSPYHHPPEEGFWDIAAERAPDENPEYYFYCTLVAIAVYMLLHFLVHAIAEKKYAEYRDEMNLR